ncbi:FliI/YscN family ATPase [Albibacillus kandeliae]|uniref:FliI/YscN family ATPase n=1 Tax=Albibacillus kandeliae TaxID=2174228 RepID=UPI000D6882D7|nr:FliI/YscN family ATPase [Albibacillus kandeliae]
MAETDMDALKQAIEDASLSRPVGRVREISGGVAQVSGLATLARIGDRVELRRGRLAPLAGEILQIEGDLVGVLPDTTPDGVARGDAVLLQPRRPFAPADHWIGRLVDPFGQPLDGEPLLPGARGADLMCAPPPAATRRPLGDRINTGYAVLNTLLPIVAGQRLGLFAGSGVGKSRLLAQLARNMEADVVVVALIGERGREVNEFVTRVLGGEGMRRAVVVAATSDQSALTRRRCAWAAMSVAEHFRDTGRNVLLLADSVTRFAEAHREIAVAAGEAPALRGYPPSIAPLITALCERAGPGAAGQGHITAVFSVLVAGSDMEEPVADILRGVLDGHVVLSRDIAERGRFPAIDVGRSVSRSLPDAATAAENTLLSEARRMLGVYEQSEVMIRAGLYSEGADPRLDSAVRLWPELDAFFARSEPGQIRDSFDRLDLILRRALGPEKRKGSTQGD